MTDPATERISALLAPLTNYERTRPDRTRWSLAGMERVLASIHWRPAGLRLIQVGGSKGKGTTVLYLESLARSAGIRCGSYLSPHLETLLERVRLDGQSIDEEPLRQALEPILEAARSGGHELSFFEAMTGAALASFRSAGVELGLLEVGLGGRLDATTAVPVDVSIVTSIELEHTELLGDTVEAIAAEKAFVIRPGGVAFTGVNGPALAALEARAGEVGAELRVLGRDFGWTEMTDEPAVRAGTLWGIGTEPIPFRVPGAAAVELPALALAAAALHEVFPEAAPPFDPVSRPGLPGRCEVWTCGDGHPLVLDGAHTEASARHLADELARRFPGQRVALLFASAAGKRWRETLKCLLPMADITLVTAVTGTSVEPPETVAAWLRDQGGRAEVVTDVAVGLRRLAEWPGPRVVTGSFYLVGAARSHRHILDATAT